MSSSYTYPGVYIQELPSPVHTIASVATSITAFVGYTPRGIDNRAQEIFSFGDFERLYGGLATNSELSYAVQQFYQNKGSDAIVVRVPMHGAIGANVVFDSLTFTALSSGAWANGQLLIDIDVQNVNLTVDPLAFNLTITDLADQTSESFPNVTLDHTKNNYVSAVVNDTDNGSQLVNVAVPSTPPTTAAVLTGVIGTAITSTSVNTAVAGNSAKITATQDFNLVMSTSSPGTPPTPLPLTIKVFTSGSSIPQTLSGLANQLQQAINAVLAVKMPGASVTCSVSPVGTGKGLRVNASLPQNPDAVVIFSAPASGGDASAALGINNPSLANVAHYALGTGNAFANQTSSTKGSDGSGLPQSGDIIGDPAKFSGIYALLKVDLFNLLSIPDATRALPSDPSSPDTNVDYNAIYGAAITLCDQRRAFLLIDPPPNVNSVAGAVDWKSSQLAVVDPNGAAFFPRLRLPDPQNNFQLRTFAPSGVVAGVYASIDATRGVWKAPAGIEATLGGVQSMAYKLNDPENGVLNPIACN